jgi:hypothetical protein
MSETSTVEPMTLREAAERTSRSITTLRRYIRSGRLRAEKRYGRFGPEYFVSAEDLADAGLEPEALETPLALAPRSSRKNEIAPRGPRQRPHDESVPLTLFQDLQMKHEQLLVQYGMIRSAGLRVMEQQAELEIARKKAERASAEMERMREQMRDRCAELESEGRRGRLELEARALEIEALRSKVKTLELLTRNAVTNETIDRQFGRVLDQVRRVDALDSAGDAEAPREGDWGSPPEPRDH